MKYDNLTINKLRELSILDVADKLGFKLKGLGDEGRRAICPYHDDQHPSLHFSKKKGIFKCFVCGAKGDLFKLVMDDRNCSFVEACDWLVNEFHVVVVENMQPMAGNSSKSNSKLNNSETNFGQFPCEAGKKIAIVESEKSAVILSEKFTDFVWLSCGGLQSFKPQLLSPLVNYKVIIFPDTDPTGDAFRLWSQVALEAQRLYKFRYPLRVSPLLESHASPDQKSRKIDLVDFLYENFG